MLKIRRLQIALQTQNNKKHGCDFTFNTNGLNLIKAGNHSGKTTCAKAIFFSLGMEELLGGQNTASLDSILKSQIPVKDYYETITEGKFLLEIENHENKIITIKRYSKHVDIKPKAIYIYENLGIENIDENSKSLITYIHDGGAAENELGFHFYLEKYLNLNLPKVPSYNEREVKLYLQVIFNSFFIEQTHGWTDFFATVPNFNIKEPSKRIVEYLLNLDSIEYEKNKFTYETEKTRIKNSWKDYLSQVESLIENNLLIFHNKFSSPISKDKFKHDLPQLIFKDNEIELSLSKYRLHLSEKIKELNTKIQNPENQDEKKLFEIRAKLKKIARKISQLNSIIELKTNELVKTKKEYDFIESEMRKLTDLLKIKRYTNDNDVISKIAKGKCPTCNQDIDKSFHSKIEIMGVEENKKYLDAQKQILKNYLLSIEIEIDKQKELVKFLENEYSEKREIIKYLEKDISYNSNISTQKAIINLETKSKFFQTIESNFETIIKRLKELSKDWKDNELNKTSLETSPNDIKKINDLEKYLKHLLFEFGYDSKNKEQILISREEFEKYLPVVFVEFKNQKIRLNSSASDFVRALWAYYISLYQVSKKYKSNHIGLFLFDEPAQHAMDETSQKKLLETLSQLDNCQSLVFSSFEDKENNPVGKEKFNNMIQDIKDDIHIIEIKNKAIKEIID